MRLSREDARRFLKVSVGATKRELTTARNRMHKQHHPDRAGGDTRLAQVWSVTSALASQMPSPLAEPLGRGAPGSRCNQPVPPALSSGPLFRNTD